MRRLIPWVLTLLGWLLPALALEPADVVVVYNADSVLSTRSARRYALLRNIPPRQLVALSGLAGGTISRADYEQKIVEPLLAVAKERGWSWPAAEASAGKRILAMLLMPDIPLAIAAEPRPQGAPAPRRMEEDHAAVDSELMVLGGRFPARGMLLNPCYDKTISLGADRPRIMAVCRIDGPDAACISRMIEDPVEVERQGLWGWVVVDSGGPYKQGNDWMAEIATQAQLVGQPLFHDKAGATLADAFPLMPDTAVYFGWYTHMADGPFRPEAGGGFRFARGAVALHLHSFSATSVKDAKVWVGALLSRGAAVTAGNVHEPYLPPSLHFDIFYNRLRKGHCVAEAALMASPVASWQGIVLGDPLYRPFAAMGSGGANNAFADWWRLRRVHGDCLPALHQAVREREAGADGALFAEMFAWHCVANKQTAEAAEAFAVACGRYTEFRDRLRAAISAATVLAADKKQERARSLLRPWLQAGLTSPYLPAIKHHYRAIGGGK